MQGSAGAGQASSGASCLLHAACGVSSSLPAAPRPLPPSPKPQTPRRPQARNNTVSVLVFNEGFLAVTLNCLVSMIKFGRLDNIVVASVGAGSLARCRTLRLPCYDAAGLIETYGNKAAEADAKRNSPEWFQLVGLLRGVLGWQGAVAWSASEEQHACVMMMRPPLPPRPPSSGLDQDADRARRDQSGVQHPLCRWAVLVTCSGLPGCWHAVPRNERQILNPRHLSAQPPDDPTHADADTVFIRDPTKSYNEFLDRYQAGARAGGGPVPHTDQLPRFVRPAAPKHPPRLFTQHTRARTHAADTRRHLYARGGQPDARGRHLLPEPLPEQRQLFPAV
jgi:hypothetical protein